MLDPSLRAFVESGDGEDAQRRLSALLVDEAAPLVRRILGRKFRTYGGGRESFSTQDLEDVVADALLALVGRLNSLREDPASSSIESFTDYTATVAHNAFTHYLRRKYPARSRLKNHLRYVLSRDRRFALWPGPDGLLCGLSRWRGGWASADAARNLAAFSPAGDDPVSILEAVLKAAGGPVEFDLVVGVIAPLASGADRPLVSLDGAGVATRADEKALPADVMLDQKRETERLWREVCALPVRQRAALLLNLRDARGAGLLWVFPLTGVASLREIAHALEIPDVELATLWNGLPIDDRGIAERLDCTRQQVINLRSAARKRLTHRLGGPAGSSTRGKANIAMVSASLVDEE